MSYDFPNPEDILPSDDEAQDYEFTDVSFITPDETAIGRVYLSADQTLYADVFYTGDDYQFLDPGAFDLRPLEDLLREKFGSTEFDDITITDSFEDFAGNSGTDYRAFVTIDDARRFLSETKLPSIIYLSMDTNLFYVKVVTD